MPGCGRNNRPPPPVCLDVDAPDSFRQQLLSAIPRLRRYARSLSFDTGSADDLVQSTLERALSHWHQFDQRRDMLVWLLSIAHNAFLDQRRRDSRLSIVDPAQVDAQQDMQRADPGADVGLRIDLINALARLPIEQREPLLLVSVEQFSYAECAEALGIPIGTVMSRISRGRAALRDSLEGRSRPEGVRTLRRVI
ncbi:MAG: RNA polymerase subunit sigma-24 [Burkholderiales bacterium PBB5]|nr:MAG: RNA polymerase subunit sigma-24 [Burkholderiales bacterium PBB5]